MLFLWVHGGILFNLHALDSRTNAVNVKLLLDYYYQCCILRIPHYVTNAVSKL